MSKFLHEKLFEKNLVKVHFFLFIFSVKNLHIELPESNELPKKFSLKKSVQKVWREILLKVKQTS